MGNGRQYNPGGGFSDYLYHSVGDVIQADGLTGKVLLKNDVTLGKGTNSLPSYSNTSQYYFRLAEDGSVDQMRMCEGRKMELDYDWGHVPIDPPHFSAT